MQFVYHEEAGKSVLSIEDELYKYLVKVRRHNTNETVYFRNLTDHFLYAYTIESISKKNAMLILVSQEEKVIMGKQKCHLAWCVVDTKTIEKQLPYLNELGVEKLSFVYADYLQKNFQLNLDKFTRILINSSQQCGRSSLIQFEVFKSVDEFLTAYPTAYMFNFSQTFIDSNLDIPTIIVGCEGGFSKREVELFESNKVVGVNSDLILRSETAITLVASKLLV
jgi:16S rRNA (uracil1498-N3)-methyltransferase